MGKLTGHVVPQLVQHTVLDQEVVVELAGGRIVASLEVAFPRELEGCLAVRVVGEVPAGGLGRVLHVLRIDTERTEARFVEALVLPHDIGAVPRRSRRRAGHREGGNEREGGRE